MNKETSAGRYTSPEAYVTSVIARRVMCSSITGMEPGFEQDDITF